MNLTLGTKVLLSLCIVLLGIAQYYVIPFWGNDPALAKMLMLSGTAVGYAGLGWWLLTNLHRTCPIRRMRARRHGPTILR